MGRKNLMKREDEDLQKHLDAVRSRYYIETKLRLIMEELQKQELQQYEVSKLCLLGRWFSRIFSGGGTV